eukprot:IDg9398t1
MRTLVRGLHRVPIGWRVRCFCPLDRAAATPVWVGVTLAALGLRMSVRPCACLFFVSSRAFAFFTRGCLRAGRCCPRYRALAREEKAAACAGTANGARTGCKLETRGALVTVPPDGPATAPGHGVTSVGSAPEESVDDKSVSSLPCGSVGARDVREASLSVAQGASLTVPPDGPTAAPGHGITGAGSAPQGSVGGASVSSLPCDFVGTRDVRAALMSVALGASATVLPDGLTAAPGPVIAGSGSALDGKVGAAPVFSLLCCAGRKICPMLLFLLRRARPSPFLLISRPQ